MKLHFWGVKETEIKSLGNLVQKILQSSNKKKEKVKSEIWGNKAKSLCKFQKKL